MNSGQGSDSAGESTGASDRKEKRLIERLREAIRSRHYSRRTEQTYWYWIRYFVIFHGKRHPAEMGAAEVTAFLSWLATERNVAAATQNQALSALLFLYKQVLGVELPWLGELVRAQRPVRIPSVLTRSGGAPVARLRVGHGAPDGRPAVRRGLAADRVPVAAREGRRFRLPADPRARWQGREATASRCCPRTLVQPLQRASRQRARAARPRSAEGFGEVWLPYALARKYPRAAREWALAVRVSFAASRSADPDDGVMRRHHVHPRTTLQRGGEAGARAAPGSRSA